MNAAARKPPNGSAARLLLATCLLLSACSDGYPTEDLPQVDPASLSQAGLVQALNALGNEPQLDKRWQYELVQGCELQVRVRKGTPPERRLVLEGATIEQRSRQGLHEVLLLPEAGRESDAIVVLASPRWTDAVRMRSLLTHLELSCGDRLPGTARR